VSVEKLFPTGAWRVSAVVKGYLISRVYYGYSRRESLAIFKRDELS